MKEKEYNGLYYKLKSHGVTIYAVAKAGGWSWQQVAGWAKGTRVPQLATFRNIRSVMRSKFGIDVELEDVGRGGAR